MQATALASLAVVPFQPLAVTGLHTALMEGKFVRAAASDPAMRGVFALHSATNVAGAACFALEDAAIDRGANARHASIF